MSQLPDNWLSERTVTVNVRQTERSYRDGHRTVETEASFRSEVCSAPDGDIPHRRRHDAG